ncbi:hypothetical protein V8F33_014106 [Rhypophila sp. PSN 637]
MTASYQEVQYASNGRVSHLETPDPICQRIQISTGPRYRHSGGPGRQRPQWSPRQVKRLTAVSPALQARVNRLIVDSDGGNVWPIESRPDDGISANIASHVLDMIAFNEPARNEIEDEASVVSQYCNILWFFEAIPTRFPTCDLWAVIDSPDTRNIIGALHLPPPLRHIATNGTDYSHLSFSATGHPTCCWSHPSSPYPYETALHLANCALILNWKEAFRRAIKPVIWETGPAEAVLVTPVKYLKQAGPDGINKSRKQEKEQVLSFLTRYLMNRQKTDSQNVETTIEILSNRGIEIGDEPDRFDQPSVYQLLRKIEAVLLPPPPPPAVPAPGRLAHSRKPTHGSSKTNSSSGSHNSASGAARSGGPSRQDTNMTSGTSHTHKSSSSKQHSGSRGGGGSGSKVVSSPPSSRPLGPSLTQAVEKLHWKLSNNRREQKAEPEPDPALGPRGGPAGHADFVCEMLKEIHNFILDRQAMVAEDMLARRDLDVAGWEERLLP